MLITQLPDDFGSRLAGFRLAAKLKQSDLAKVVGVDGSTISRYEGAELVPSLADAQRLLRSIGTQEALEYAGYLGQHWQRLHRPPYDHPQCSALWTAEQALQRLVRFRESGASDAAGAQAELLESALKREAAYLEDRSHDIPFIGIIGVGKTTALSTAVGLMLPPARDERRIKRTVLEVGGGNTTTCEVVLLHDSNRWGLIVVPQSEQEIVLNVNDLCAGVVSPQAGEQALDGEPRGVPKEIDRALRNMSGLPKRQIKTPDGKRVTIDPMLELPEGRSLEGLASEVFKRLRLWQRTRTELWYHPSSSEEPAAWLRKAFSDVNNGRAPDVSLPKQITVVAPLRLLGQGRYQLRVIDTKGIDEELADRPDLRSYLEDPRAIPVLCSPFTSAPDSSIVQLLRGAAETGAWAGAAQRSTLLVLPKNDEALQVKHDSGDLPESFEEGYEIKADKVRDALRKMGPDGLPIVMYNSDIDDADPLAEVLHDRIEAVRSIHVKRIEETARAVENLIEDAYRAEVAPVYARVYVELRALSERSAALTPSSVRPYEKLISAIKSLHPRTVWASVIRQGSWINLDVYHYLGTGVAIDAQERCRMQVLELEAALGRMLADDGLAPVHGFLKEALKSIGCWRDEFLQIAARLGKDSFRPALREAGGLWKASADEYGRGYGFRDRVAQHFQRWFEDSGQRGVFESLESALAGQWSICVAANVEKLVASMRPAGEQGTSN